MRRILLATLFSLGLTAGVKTASAQDASQPKPVSGLPVESVIVTAPKMRPEKMLNDFIAGHTAPTPLVGKIARWRVGICPISIGLDKFNTFITQRIIEVAKMAGARLDFREPCYPNLVILATDKPQDLVDRMRTKYPYMLDIHHPHDTSLTTMQRPIQAWYWFVLEDFMGFVQSVVPDIGWTQTGAMGIRGGVYVSGNRAIGDGLKSEIQFAIVIVDTNKITGREIGALADYIAMLGLSQGQGYDTCQPVPTITNLFAADCGPDMTPSGLTDIDLTYLRGLYKMDAGRSFFGERASIAYEIKKDLGGY